MTDPIREAVAELASRVELSDVRYHAIVGRQKEPPSDAEEADQSLQVMIGSHETSFSIRCRVEFEAPDATYEVDASIHYSAEEPLEVDETVLRGFAEHIGILALYPYLRSAVHDLSSRLGVGRALMPIVRAGTLQLDDPEIVSTEN